VGEAENKIDCPWLDQQLEKVSMKKLLARSVICEKVSMKRLHLRGL
jgi:hypothetical protein